LNTVRIIGGEWRRRLLRFPDSPSLRPTPDRVRETLFNWLGNDLRGLSCLDLFAGSGALGFEAASRGAERVVLVDSSPKVLAALELNARTLGMAGRLEIVRSDAVRFATSASSALTFCFSTHRSMRAGSSVWRRACRPLSPRTASSTSRPKGCGGLRRLAHGAQWAGRPGFLSLDEARRSGWR
jgi:hypothetical protein